MTLPALHREGVLPQATKASQQAAIVLTLISVALTGLLVVWQPFIAVVPLGCLLLIWLLLTPGLALALMVLTLPLMRSVFGMPGYIVMCFPIVALIIFGISSFVQNKTRVNRVLSVPLFLGIVLIVYTFVSYWFREYSEQGTLFPNPLTDQGPTFFLWIIPTFLMFIIIGSFIKHRSQLKLIIYSLMAAAIAVTIVGLLQRVVAYDFIGNIYRSFWGSEVFSGSNWSTERISSVFYDSNYMANFLVVSFLICIPFLLCLRMSLSRRVLVIIALSLVLLAIGISFSAANWIALGIGLASLWFLMPLKNKIRALGAIVVVILLVVFLAAYGLAGGKLIPQSMQAKFAAVESITGGMSALEHGAYSDRASWIRYGMEIFHQNPIFGVGTGGLRVLVNYPHNSYVLMLAEGGLLGMLLLLVFIGSVVAVGISNLRRSMDSWLRYLQIGTLASMFASLVWLFTYDCLMYALPLWLAMGITLAIRSVTREEGGLSRGTL